MYLTFQCFIFLPFFCRCHPGGVHLPRTVQFQCWSQRLGCQAAEAQPHAETAHPGSPVPPMGGWVLHQEAHHPEQRRAWPMSLFSSPPGWSSAEHRLYKGVKREHQSAADLSESARTTILTSESLHMMFLSAGILSHLVIFLPFFWVSLSYQWHSIACKYFTVFV